jgi:hypothetical protein
MLRLMAEQEFLMRPGECYGVIDARHDPVLARIGRSDWRALGVPPASVASTSRVSRE